MRFYERKYRLLMLLMAVLAVASCARMGQPDGGWFDETPPKIVRATPAENATGVTSRRIQIDFDEYIKVDNPTEKVTISPPQAEMPDIKTTGKGIRIDLKDSLKANTTYTIDFSDAISDNNEGNPLGNYTYTFSTGESIDTLEMSGYVINAEDLEPLKGILVGLYSNPEDSAFTTEPMLRVARTDESGHFIIRGIAEGNYRIYALEDGDGDYKLSQRGERLAFTHDMFSPYSKPDIRQDTIWSDTLHIRSIERVPYTHYFPDDICLRAFTQELTDRYFIKADRQEPNRFVTYFSYGSEELPKVQGLNFDDTDAFIVEPSLRGDTITYWLRDQQLVDQDTLQISLTYLMTDSLGSLVSQTDTLEVLSKKPFAKRQKELDEKKKEWEKKMEKRRKKGEDVPDEMPREPLTPVYAIPQTMTPNRNLRIVIPTPLTQMDTAAIHLYSKHDTLWYNAPLKVVTEGMPPRTIELQGEWKMGIEYSLEVDSAAFVDIYGNVSDAKKTGFRIATEDQFGTLFVEVPNDTLPTIVQLLQGENRVATATAVDGTAEFYYLAEGDYYISYYTDVNQNGQWDTGDYALDLQPEPLFFHPEAVEIKALWDRTVRLNPSSAPLYRQKPGKIRKQKATQKKKVQNRNQQRAAQLGIQYINPK